MIVLKDTTSVTLPKSQPSTQNLQNTFLKLHTISDKSNKRQKIQTSIDNYADKCNNEEQEEINQYLACAIFGSGLPLSLVEDKYFIAFCKKLRPAYELPSCRKLSIDLLIKM